MKKSIKLQLRASEIRTEVNKLELTEANAEKRRQLVAELETVEKEFRDALTAEAEEERSTPAADGLTPEEREYRGVVQRASLGAIFDAVVDHRMIEGAEREMQKHLGLAGNQVPLDLLEQRAVTPAPANVGQNQAAIVPGVFPMACASFLGIPMPRVSVGEAVYPVLTTNADAGVPNENAAQAETTGAFSADVLAPGRIQASFFFSREDRARFLGMDPALRDNLGMALGDKLDDEILSGTEGLFTGVKLPNNNVAAVTDFAGYRKGLVFDAIDGTYASVAADVRAVVGAATYAHMATVYRSNNADDSALDSLMRITGGVKVSAHVPAASGAPAKQNAVIRRGMRRDMVAPVWEGVTLIPDEVTKAGTGQIVLTAVMLYAVKILRQAGFRKQQTQHA